jgi:ribosomal protein S8
MTLKNRLASLINSINNGSRLNQFFVVSSNFTYASDFLNALLGNGFIHGYRVEGPIIKVFLKYVNARPVLRSIRYVSGPSSKRFVSHKNVTPFGVYSTTSGIKMFSAGSPVGGELLALVS